MSYLDGTSEAPSAIAATGSSSVTPDQALYTAVLTALITRPVGSKDSGQLRAVLVSATSIRQRLALRKSPQSLSGLGEELLRPDP